MPRAARPTALKLLSGEQKSRVNTDEPQAEPGVPECRSRDPKVREVWAYTVEQLQQMNLLTVADRDMLLAYCMSVVVHEQAIQKLAEEGYWVQLLGHTNPHPAIKLQREASAQMKQLASEFGLSPLARARIKVSDSQPNKKVDGRSSARLLSS